MKEDIMTKVGVLQQDSLGDDIVNPPQDDYFEEMFEAAWNSVESKSLETSSPLAPKEKEQQGKKLKKDLLTYLRTREKEILKEISSIYQSDKLTEIKDFSSLWDRLMEGLKSLFTSEEMKPLVNQFTESFYVKGMEKSELEFAQNFFPNEKAVNFLKNYNFDLVKNMTDELSNQLKSTLQRAYINNKPMTEVKTEVAKLFDKNEVRAKAIVRTEQNRAENFGRMEGAKQSSLVKGKSIINYLDADTSDLCKRMMKKYGDKTITLDDEFKDKQTGQSWSAPPFHVNCRTRLTTPRLKED